MYVFFCVYVILQLTLKKKKKPLPVSPSLTKGVERSKRIPITCPIFLVSVIHYSECRGRGLLSYLQMRNLRFREARELPNATELI